ncbi:NAD-dependent epimerase/dehydratase family protein [Vulcanococcus limneticus]|uniref:NAD-dependent epimerase/dehydratase family protein n=1 Tax=Vulcanococcus limneticus TaxID=2170428 RepID=UPI001E40C098|nr:NAD-dependent epimerase/dehydratase family protein [Vulcanococcus limneticus]
MTSLSVAAAETQPDAAPDQAIPLALAPVNALAADAAIPAADTWRGRQILITGGLGFIGSTLAIRLAEFGARVTLIDSLIPEYGGNLANIAGYEDRLRINLSDIRDRFSLEALVRGQEVIFNLAGQTSHLDSMRDPHTDLEINCTAQLSLLEICRASNPEARIVFASTRQLYGRPRYLPVDEAHPTQPVDVNGINKLSAELYHQLYAQVHGLSTSVLRLTNTIGPRMRVKDARQTFVGIWIRRLLEGDPIEVWGGQQLRDFNDVEDVVDALLLAGARRDLAPTPFNLGHGERLSLRELAELLIDLHGSGRLQVTPYPTERQRIDIGDYYSCHQRFTAATGWRPRRSLRQTLERTLAFYGSHLPAYR